MAIATAVIGLLFAILVQAPAGFILFFLPLVLVACLSFWFTKVPYRVRLPVEIAAMFSMLALSAFIWRDPGYLNEADRADEVARLATTLAELVDSPREKSRYRRTAAKFTGRATVLRWKALRNGLIEGPYKFIGVSTHDYIIDFGISEAKDRLEADMKAMGEQVAPG